MKACTRCGGPAFATLEGEPVCRRDFGVTLEEIRRATIARAASISAGKPATSSAR